MSVPQCQALKRLADRAGAESGRTLAASLESPVSLRGHSIEPNFGRFDEFHDPTALGAILFRVSGFKNAVRFPWSCGSAGAQRAGYHGSAGRMMPSLRLRAARACTRRLGEPSCRNRPADAFLGHEVPPPARVRGLIDGPTRKRMCAQGDLAGAGVPQPQPTQPQPTWAQAQLARTQPQSSGASGG
jgi:hypothetical protein